MSQGAEPPTEEDAFHCIVRFLTDAKADRGTRYGYDLYLTSVFDYYIAKSGGSAHPNPRGEYPRISPVFYSAAWDLCRRGILRPGVRQFGGQTTDGGSGGDGYSITPFGRTWLSESGGKYDYVPTEPGRFAEMLDRFTTRFGGGFKERGQEAVRCYGAHAFLACCAMCGAAAESIFLAVAVAKEKDAAVVEKAYLAAGGRGRLEKKILGQQPQPVADEFRGYTSLLKYWRDAAAHGMASGIQDSQAYTSLAMLLRFALFVEDRWAELSA